MARVFDPKWLDSEDATEGAVILESDGSGGFHAADNPLTADIKAALSGAASPSAENPFATMADVGSGGAGDGVGGALYLYNRMGGF